MAVPESDTPKSIIAERIMEDIKNKIYNPMNDVLFKFIFGSDERKLVTIDFLNAVLEREDKDAIKDIQFRNTEIIPFNEEDKLTRLDVYCITEKCEQIDVEVQILNKKNMKKRTLFYWAQMYLTTLSKGGKYQDLKPAITINILRYNLFPEKANFHSTIGLYDLENQCRFNKDLELHFLEVPKFKKKPVKEMTRMERWLAYFSNRLDEKEKEELAMKDAAIQTAFDAAHIFMQDSNERLRYLNKEMAILDYESEKAAWTEEGRNEERTDGIKNLIATIKEISNSQPQAVEQLMKRYSLTQAEAQAAVQANW